MKNQIFLKKRIKKRRFLSLDAHLSENEIYLNEALNGLKAVVSAQNSSASFA
ncbi:MAG: hypothetical protein ABIA74_03505 [bacterium]